MKFITICRRALVAQWANMLSRSAVGLAG